MTYTSMAYPLVAWCGMNKCIDDNIGRLANQVEETGLPDKTMIIFTAAPDDRPRLTDFARDPDGLENRLDDLAYRPVARRLAEALPDYGCRQQDPRVSHLKTAVELTELITSK